MKHHADDPLPKGQRANNDMDLDARKQRLLRAVIVEYVSAAEPVGSEILVQKYDLGVRSATVRNELAEMAEMGYLEQPHTSAGRIPSDRGYRYFVDRLIVEREPELATKRRVRDVAQDGEILQSLLRDSARLLSRLTHLMSAAAIIRDPDLTVRSALVSALGPTQGLLVVVLSNGHVESRMIECPPGLTLQDIGMANEQLATGVCGSTLKQFARFKPPTAPDAPGAQRLLATVWSLLKAMASDLTRGALITEGEEFMFGQPEFHRDAAAFSDLLDALKESDLLYEAIARPVDQYSSVTIGKENPNSQMHQFSVIRQNIFAGETAAGTIAVIGPTRMAYDASIPLLNYTAQALTETLTRFLG